MRPGLVLAIVSAFAVVACGQVNGNLPGGVTPVSPPARALEAWQTFPADQKPRPIVSFWDLGPSGGAFTGGDSKLAAMCGKFTLGIALPIIVQAQANAMWPDGTTASYKAISAKEAFTAITKSSASVNPPECASLAGLQITTARFATAPFRTDRGIVQMSAWRFGAPGVVGELDYPALPLSAFWKSAITSPTSGTTATISVDGLTLTFVFYGAPATSGPCGADYKGVVAESSSAVAVALQTIPHASPGAPFACDAMAQQRSVTLTLASPLGGRVVIDVSGNATPVCPAAKPGC
jgi:hypothetical protein